MCGIAGIFGKSSDRQRVLAMISSQHHRGPDANGLHVSPQGSAVLGHNRLSIIDLSEAGRQPMLSSDRRFCLSFNGEIYNYKELRSELSEYNYVSTTDSEVILAAYTRWGAGCLDHFIGMFSILIWDEHTQELFAARDRFGVKPLYYHEWPDGTLLVASEIKALHAAGLPAVPDEVAWATYLSTGLHDNSEQTFWKGVRNLPAGSFLKWNEGNVRINKWYDLAQRVSPSFDERPLEEVKQQHLELLRDSIRLRFRADVPVGINLSGGLDSSTLLALVNDLHGPEAEINAFTFITGDENYDELPWVNQMLAQTRHPLTICELNASEVPDLAQSVNEYEDEPFGGLPTLCYSRLFEAARSQGVKVLLDGQGMDEQGAGYDYYLRALKNDAGTQSIVQGTNQSPLRPDCLVPEFRALAEVVSMPQPFSDSLRNLQYRDAHITKLPRALRFNDRVSMRSSVELREPFLDHRLFELAFNQPPERKVADGKMKWLLREVIKELLPSGISEAPKRPLQTPQREWLRGPLRHWANDCIETLLASDVGSWFDPRQLRLEWKAYCEGDGDNSFFIWQWVNLGLLAANEKAAAAVV